MSKYTTEVRFICETNAGLVESVGYNSVNDVVEKSWNKIFDFDFPIFDENYRKILCKKILKHFYTREIGEETVGLWKLRLDTRLNEIMPYYNKLYETELFKFDPLTDVDYTRKHTLNRDETRKDNTTDSNSGNSTASNESLYSDTPQGAITGLKSETYLTNATIDNGKNNFTNSGTSKTDSTINSLDDYIENITGKTNARTFQSLVKETRENILNIDMMVIAELETLFMMIW